MSDLAIPTHSEPHCVMALIGCMGSDGKWTYKKVSHFHFCGRCNWYVLRTNLLGIVETITHSDVVGVGDRKGEGERMNRGLKVRLHRHGAVFTRSNIHRLLHLHDSEVLLC